MTATQLTTRHGGWPNSVFMTPDLEPFYAGTYFPPEDRYGRPGFPSLLRNPPPPLAQQQGAGRRYRCRDRRGDPAPPVRGPCSPPGSGHYPRPRRGRRHSRPLRRHQRGLRRRPQVSALHRPRVPDASVGGREAAQKAASVVDHTLRAMADGGICDQVGGGFHRYATDARWRVPPLREDALQPGAARPPLHPAPSP